MVLQHLVYNLLQYRRMDAEGTSVFKNVSHNKVLCPAVQRKSENILDTFQKYHHISYDIQGLKDEGVDVLIRLKDGEVIQYILFQIKSESDLQIKNLLGTLRDQWFRAVHMYVDYCDYYILLCCESKKNKDKIRAIEGAFAKTERTHVIEPEYSLTFLTLSNIQIDAYAKSKLGQEDIVFRLGSELMQDLTPTERALLLQIIYYRLYGTVNSIAIDDLMQSPFLTNIYSNTPDYYRNWFFKDDEAETFEAEDIEDEEWHYEFKLRNMDFYERLSTDLEYLTSELLSYGETGKIILNESSVRPIIVLMLDGEIRYEYTDLSLLEYMLTLFGPMKGYQDKIEPLKSEFQ